MATEVYKNWINKVADCGFTKEQACGIAMLYAWSLTHRSSENETQDPELFWTFLDQNEFNEMNENAFNMQDFLMIAPEFQMAGALLQVNMPSERYAENGEPATFFDGDWKPDAENTFNLNNNLLFRSRFDLMWCQRIGECLRSEIRTPLHAFVFTNNITHTFSKIDPVGFNLIIKALLLNMSPLISIFTSKKLVKEAQGLKGYEPFQIALMGFTGGLDLHLSESLWGLQRLLFYKQPGGMPINLEKQYLSAHHFLDFAEPIIDNFINIKRPSYLDLTRFISSEYIYGSISEAQFQDQLSYLLESRYGFNLSVKEEYKPQDFLMNAAVFYTACCLKIKNLTNQIAKQPSLKMLDDKGLIWFKDVDVENPLRLEAIYCFDVMLSWRLGPGLGFFIKTINDKIHIFYLGEFASNEDIEAAVCEIYKAYEVKECILAFLLDNFPLKNDKPDKNLKVAFLNLPNKEKPFIDLYRCDTGLQEGIFLDDYVGAITDEDIVSSLFKNLQGYSLAEIDRSERRDAQSQLIERHGSIDAWGFVDT